MACCDPAVCVGRQGVRVGLQYSRYAHFSIFLCRMNATVFDDVCSVPYSYPTARCAKVCASLKGLVARVRTCKKRQARGVSIIHTG